MVNIAESVLLPFLILPTSPSFLCTLITVFSFHAIKNCEGCRVYNIGSSQASLGPEYENPLLRACRVQTTTLTFSPLGALEIKNRPVRFSLHNMMSVCERNNQKLSSVT